MSDVTVFERLFGAGHGVEVRGHFVRGNAEVAGRPVAVIGTWNSAAVDGDLALAVSGAILDVVAEDAKSAAEPRPIVFIADTEGQELSRREELLGLNGCFAHVARCVDLARRRGHPILTLIHGRAVSGGFLAFGMLAERVCALPGAQVRVMDLRAMSRVTKIALDRLEGLAKESPVFAPGADNYWRMGAVDELWPEGSDDWDKRLAGALDAALSGPRADRRAVIGAERGGRTLAAKVAATVLEA
ncbi:biotin-independent malonate decarboxylase subunit gamma [Azoarcus sp. KH32C]|uniref:biotin-independent malonate decarboxylase subunit gamma n=1 Tax=Azoarcus sp. KH32C TaxID=748247 RepID=UPI0002386E93|nr:biotin-independent malonate decarboxylase subunit gamma [Azoarcus sp. KH32C]BAL23908.1 malonate decarboxylase, gamma subunit [Azoarcus sp. KH32C]